MSALKTLPNDASVMDFINSVDDETQRNDSLELLKLFKRVTGHEPRMWGTSIIGYDMFHYKSERSTQEGDWPLTGFSPRKQNLTLYIMSHLDSYTDFLNKLGKHKTSKACLYIKRLSDVNLDVLEELISKSYQDSKEHYSKTQSAIL